MGNVTFKLIPALFFGLFIVALSQPAPAGAQEFVPLPVACYDFDTVEDVIGSNDKSLGSGVTVGNAGGVVGNSLVFDDEFFGSATFSSPTTTTSDVTVAYWVKDEGFPGVGQSWVGSAGFDGWLVTYLSDGRVQAYYDASDSNVTLGTSSSYAGTWNFVVVRWQNNGEVTAFIDNVENRVTTKTKRVSFAFISEFI